MELDLIFEQIENVIDKKLPLITNLSNASAILNQLEDINWAGFYLVDNGRLVLGPFQGEVACTVIEYGRGVCGSAYKAKETIVVPDVNEFAGHIACSSKSRSEIVVPIIKDDEVVGVIDIDSPIYDRFHEEEQDVLEGIAFYLSELF